MAEENVEIVTRAFEAIGRGDLEGMAALLAPGFEYVPTGAFVGVRETTAGPEGFMRFLESFWSEFDEPSIELREATAVGDKVVTWATFSGRGARSGAETSLDLWGLWTLSDGRVTSGRAFSSRSEALEAAGVSE